MPGVGVVTAASFVSTLDEAERFAGPKQARAYLGLVPSERSSGERQQRGHISKAGPGRARHMLVEAAWTILRRRSPTNSALHEWAVGIAARRGSRVAAVALARKLAGILFAMWRDGTTFALPSLEAYEKTEGGDARGYGLAIDGLALAYLLQRKYEEAEPIYKRAVAHYEKAFGEIDETVARALENYAELLRRMKRDGEAEALVARAKTIRGKGAK